jgi:TRAP-type uncharacterized transport system substrate-binding protein
MAALCCCIAACEQEPAELRIQTQTYQDFDPGKLQAVFEQKSNIRIGATEASPGLSSLEALMTERADLTVVENSTPFRAGVRAILPVFESILHLLVRSNLQSSEQGFPLAGKSVHVVNNSIAGNTLLDAISKRQGLSEDDFQRTAELQPGVTDVIIYFGPINPGNPQWYHEGYEFFSLESRQAQRYSPSQEGISFLVSQMKPMTIPAGTYHVPGNEWPVHTVSVDALLVTRKTEPEAAIYELTKTLIEQKPRFVAVAPSLFSGINESFDPLALNFPLHSGARRYLQRDEPSFLERYAETINMLVYLLFLLLTGFIAAARWRAQRKKDRIDTFYTRVLAIRRSAADSNPQQLWQELRALEEEAFDSLIREKLAADESFRIFTNLLTRTQAELEEYAQADQRPDSPV